MKRKDIEPLMQRANQEFIIVVFNPTDQYGALCQMKRGILHDATGHRVPLKQEIWGIIAYEDGKPVRYPIEEKINEILFCQ